MAKALFRESFGKVGDLLYELKSTRERLAA